MDDVLPFSKHKKTNLGSLVTHCILQPIAHRLQANCARTSQKTAICKVHGLNANGGGKKKIRQDWIERFVPFVSMSRLAGVVSAKFKYADTNGNFLSFYAALSNSFIPIRRIFIKYSFYFKKMEQYHILVLLLYKTQKVGCVRWLHDRCYSRLYSNFAKKWAKPIYLYRNFVLKL